MNTYLARQSDRDFDWHNRIAADIRNGLYYLLNDIVSNVKAPTLILWGDKDQIVKLQVGRAYHQAIAGSEFGTFTNCGHCPPIRTSPRNRRSHSPLPEKHHARGVVRSLCRFLSRCRNPAEYLAPQKP